MKATPDTLSHNPTGVLSTLRHVEMWTAIRNERHVALIKKKNNYIVSISLLAASSAGSTVVTEFSNSKRV